MGSYSREVKQLRNQEFRSGARKSAPARCHRALCHWPRANGVGQRLL